MPRKRKPAADKPREPRIERAGSRNGLTAWLVDGSWVRKNIDEEFSNFGHHYTYDEIPKGELWLDSETDPDERRFYLSHMRREYRLRERGIDEETARKRANARAKTSDAGRRPAESEKGPLPAAAVRRP